MAEGCSERKVYFTRSRKRSMDPQEPRTSLESIDCENEVVDLALDEPDNDCPIPGDVSSLECAICLQTCVHPARLPCGHIFCFLCLKGAAHGNRSCAMCRSPIPLNYFLRPELLETPQDLTAKGHDGFEWFYEGRNGWWQYDPRAGREIESAWEAGLMEFELLIAGFLYIIDFREMLQIRKEQPGKSRKIKRDCVTAEKIGIAGIRGPVTTRKCTPEEKRCEDDDYDKYSVSSSDGFDFLLDQLSLNSDDDDSYQ